MRIVESKEFDLVSGGVVAGPDGQGCTDPRGTTTQPKSDATAAQK